MVATCRYWESDKVVKLVDDQVAMVAIVAMQVADVKEEEVVEKGTKLVYFSFYWSFVIIIYF